ncbi:DNRLRE domain-containing protein [Tessaracoccus defluvii]|uniref:DNRLRE domain-containing protein n=2 Tax=Tessaracoccus defluvii TaxID=1285901 RepID=A0A7H0H7H2_9ACTN|nr:DNRLRE domain-containing protein [Tessaracoccus defluvii]
MMRVWRCVLWLFVSVALVAGVSPAWADPGDPEPEPVGEVSRPDWTSASVTARVQGVRVEVLSERTETMRVWAHPDGSVEEETAFAPVRFEDAAAADGWRDIDTTLVAASDGSVAPIAMPVEVELGTGSEELVVFAAGSADEMGLGLDGVTLPVPVLDGSVAVYPEVFVGVDLSVEVRSSGFEVLWVVKSAEAAAGLVERFGADGSVSLPLKLRSKVPVSETDAGGVELSQLGDQVGVFVAPSMWDSSAEVPGERGDEQQIEFEVAPAPAARSGSTSGPVTRDVDVVADQEWLLDESRVFPVVIDPTYGYASGTPVFDTFVQQGYSSDQSASAELKLGNNGSGQVARSYLNFDAALFKNRQILGASLSLFESHSWSCTARSFSSYDAGLASSATRWAAQPSIGVKRASVSAALGYSSSCPASRVDINMTEQAKAWSATTQAQVGMMLRADDETDSLGWKRFHSSEGSYKPVIAVSYNRPPNVPPAPWVAGNITSGGFKYVGNSRPTLSATVSDPDLNGVTAVFSRFTSASSLTATEELCRVWVASGSSASCVPTVDLPGNTTMWLRVTLSDGHTWSGWGPAFEVRTGYVVPTAPPISCPSGNGSWDELVRAAETCTITGLYSATASYSAPTSVMYRVDGGAWRTESFTPLTASRVVASASVGGTTGGHSLEAYVTSIGGRQSPIAKYAFGYGAPSLTAPAGVSTTHGSVKVTAVGAPQGSGPAVTGAVQWRLKGSGATWTDIPAAVTAAGVFTGSFDSASILAANPTIPKRVSAVFEIRAKFQYGTATPLFTEPREVVRVPHAFGAGFPTTEVATGQVALWTGEFQVSESDADLATPGGGLSISRTHSTWAGDTTVAQSVFGPGWTASLDGGPMGVSEMELADNTLVDGTLVLVSAEGDVFPFGPANDAVRTTTTLQAGDYLPIGPDAEATELTLKLATEGGQIKVTAKDKDGIETLFTAPALSSAAAEAKFVTDSVTDKVTGEKTAYRYNTAGQVTAIIAPLPDGVTSCVPGTPTDGCRVLKLEYTGTGAATRLSKVSAQVNTDPDRVLSTYTYTAGRLTSQTDAVTGLTTSYTWTGADPQPKLASLTPAGQAAYSYDYGTDGKLSKVTRPVPATAGGGTAQLAGIVYGVAPAGIAGVDLAQFDRYNLPRTATTGFAVFGPDALITSTPAAGDESWRRADVWLTDAEGYTIHQGRYGGGQWQLTAAIYDASDNVIESWDAQATAELRKGDNSAYPDPLSAATSTRYNQDEIKSADGTAVLVAARTRVTDVFTPAAMILAAGADMPEMLRRHVATTYDQGAPSPGLSLATTETITAERLDGTVAETLSTTFTGYEALVSGDKTGWDLKQATSVTLDMNANGTADASDIRKETRYDNQGRISEQRQPGAANSDPGTRATIYWSAGGNARDAACGNQPKWAGYVCKEGPAGQPAGTTIPVTIHSDYQWHGAAATSQDISGTVTRTQTVTFDSQARPVTVTTSVTGLTGSTPLPAVTTSYDTYSRVTGTSSAAGSTAMTYDTWGRELTYTITTGGVAETTTTEYNQLGDVAKVTTPKSVTVNTYDGTDAGGNAEYRGLLTKVVTTVGGFTSTATAGYDAQGNLTLEKLPGNIERRSDYDLTGELISQSYWGPQAGRTEPAAWLGWTITANAKGQIVTEHGPEASEVLPGTTTPESAEVAYRYDSAGRLIEARDTANGGCTVRSYLFDARGNRTGTNTNTATSCTATTPTTTRSYDAADRPVTGGDGTGSYSYDQLGRQLVIPAVDAPDPAKADIALGYYDDDSARSITQGTTTLTYGLDVAGRRSTETSTVEARTVTNHYVDNSDNPGWITNASMTGTATTVYADLVSGDLSLSIITENDTTRGELALTTPRGDVASTITLNTSDAAADGLDSWTRYTEYGQPITTQPTGTGGAAGNGYGWLGAKQRTTTTTGILLMGARLYNPTTGLFTSNDPIYGGNDTPYTYPNDPVNDEDISGQAGWLKKVGAFLWKHKVDILLTAASFIPATAGIAWGYRAYKAAKLLKGGIYVIKNAKGAKYVGQSAKIGKRLQQHVAKGKFTQAEVKKAKTYVVKGTKTRREVAEQRMINKLGGKRNLLNKVNPIGPKRQHLLRSTKRNWRGL